MSSRPLPNPTSASSQVRDRPGRILVVDANPEVCALVSEQLAKKQHTVFTDTVCQKP